MQNNTHKSPFLKMSFPLNVYAQALLLEEGQAEYLHYGLFKDDTTTIQDAQRHSTELILKQLPPPPCRILEVGIGLGTTLKLLTDMGYQIQGITPDIEQVNYIQTQWDNKAPISDLSFENFAAEPNSFDVILLQESAQYIDPLVIFNQALDYLTDSGSLIILDEFSLMQKEPGQDNLHFLKDILLLASRFGFKLEEKIDLSKLAPATLDYLLKIIQKHQRQLMSDLQLPAEQLDQLNNSNRLYKEKYTREQYGYALLHFKKGKYPKWRLKHFDKQYFEKIQVLFEDSFNQPVSANFWQWKYLSGHAPELCIWEANTLVAHYGGIPRDILFFSESQKAIQIGDVMVHPQQRGILTRSGAFFRMAATFLERYIGFGRPFLLGFGFPNERAMKVAEHLGLYTEVGKMHEISWPTSSSRPRLVSCLRFIDKNNAHQFSHIIDSLWQAMAHDLRNAIVGVRDYAYLLNRYLNHPHRSYSIFVVKNRITNNPYGIVILDIKDQRCDILDIISPIKNIPLLIVYAKRFAALNHCEQLFCQITDNFSSYFQTKHSHTEVMDIRIPSNIWTTGPQPETLKNCWWLMAGDMDFR
ncbi:MAG: GNAT family N-acetyltransferase [Methyloprofundus sp.]|nr:GNAT family N-acetyltransferase [Methyloprofundus sp.]